MILNRTSYLPRMIRANESNAIFGNSTSDLLLSDYQAVPTGDAKNSTIMLPHRFQTDYNSRHVLERYEVASPGTLLSLPVSQRNVS